MAEVGAHVLAARLAKLREHDAAARSHVARVIGTGAVPQGRPDEPAEAPAPERTVHHGRR